MPEQKKHMDKAHFSAAWLLAVFPLLASAETLSARDRPEAHHPAAATNTLPKPVETIETPLQQDTATETVSKQSDNLHEALAAALRQRNRERLQQLLPLYLKLPAVEQDDALKLWAAAFAAGERGDYPAAARLYRHLLAERPDWTGVRLQAVGAFLNNKNWTEAQNELNRLQNEGGLPETLAAEVEQLSAYIGQQEDWRFSGGGTFINDKNINNAPANPDLGNGWRGEEAQAGQGLAVQLGATKKRLRAHGFFQELRFEGSGRHYWNNKPYNEASARLSLGAGHEDGRTGITLLPFFEQTWYAGGRADDQALQRFSRSGGLTLEASQRLSPRWQLNLSAETAMNRYRRRTHLDGSSHQVSLTVVYRATPRQVWFAGLDGQRSNARDEDDAYIRKGLRAGWLQDWQGFNSRVSVSYGRKQHRAAGLFGQAQDNRELGVQAAVWHRSLNWRGFVPKLNWQYTRINSNLPLYAYRKHRVFMEVGRQF